MTEYEFHPLANIFPFIEGEEFEALVADIGKNGLNEAIVLYEGKILDGRNRYLACQDNAVEPKFRTYDGNDPAGYVISLNLRRRHLNESQRAMVAARLANLPAHRPEKGANLHPSAEEAGALLNVSERSVKTAKSIQKHGVPELQGAVEKGIVSVSTAADIAQQPKERQRQIAPEPTIFVTGDQSVAGIDAVTYGEGGKNGYVFEVTGDQTAVAGGAGGDGFVMVIEFII